MARRRIAIVLLVVALVAAGCGDDGGGEAADRGPTTHPVTTGPEAGGVSAPPTSSEPEAGRCPVQALGEADGPVAVTFWHAMPERNGVALAALVDRYHDAQDRVRVNLVFQGTYNQTLDKYIASLRGGQPPHVVQMEETAMQLMLDSASTVPVADCVDADDYDVSDFAEPLFGQYSVGGRLVTMPFQLSNPVLYYNKAAFRRAGLDPDAPPRTLDEVLEVSRVIVAEGATPQAFSFQVAAWYPEQWVSMAGRALVDNDNGRSGRATRALLDDPVVGEVFEWIAAMQREGLLRNVGRDEAGTAALIAVAVEDTSMAVSTSAALGAIYDQLPFFPDIELGVAPFPGPPGRGVTVGGGSLWMLERATDQEKAAVWDLMKFLSTPESQAFWHTQTGYIPTRVSAVSQPDVQELWDERPGFRVAHDQLLASAPPPWGGGPVVGDYVGFRQAIEAAVESLLAGTDPARAQRLAQERADRVIGDYNRRIGG